MKKLYLSTLFYFLMGFIHSQTIEVIVTDSIMCKAENYSYLLSANFGGINKTRKKDKFKNELTTHYKSKYVFLYEEKVGDVRDYYWTVTYEINFKEIKDKEYFEMKMKSEKHLYSLSLFQIKIAYEEKEKIRLIKKLIQKGKEKATILAQGMGRNLGDLKTVEESKNTGQNNPEDIVIIQQLGKMDRFGKKKKVTKMKTLRITFDTEK